MAEVKVEVVEQKDQGGRGGEPLYTVETQVPGIKEELDELN